MQSYADERNANNTDGRGIKPEKKNLQTYILILPIAATYIL